MMSKGAIARAEALAAGHPRWWEVTRWPENDMPTDPPGKKTYDPDPKIKNPKKPKKGGKKK